nr:hypothetical protein [Candidatus Freyarchaeota archaeon]
MSGEDYDIIGKLPPEFVREQSLKVWMRNYLNLQVALIQQGVMTLDEIVAFILEHSFNEEYGKRQKASAEALGVTAGDIESLMKFLYNGAKVVWGWKEPVVRKISEKEAEMTSSQCVLADVIAEYFGPGGFSVHTRCQKAFGISLQQINPNTEVKILNSICGGAKSCDWKVTIK